jgi:hypothetical protein
MAKRHRYKTISKDELRLVQERDWLPVSFTGGAIPTWLNNFPKEHLVAVYGSGTYYDERIVQLGNEVIPYVVAGYDFFRLFRSASRIMNNPLQFKKVLQRDMYVAFTILPNEP